MGSENDAIIEEAAEAIRLRAQDDPPGLSVPENWRDKGIDLTYDGRQVIVRLRPVDDDKTLVEVFQRDPLLASKVLHGYSSADGLADMIEDVHRRAIERA